MADVTISLAQIQNFKTINIEGLGVLKIRRLGSGEDLDLSFKRRRLNKLIDELQRIDFAGLNVNKPEDQKKLEKRIKQADKIQDEITRIKQDELALYRGLLSDEKDGEVVKVIMDTLSDAERAEIFRIAFGEKKPIELIDAKVDENA